MNATRSLVKLLRENAYRQDLWTVWSDFVEMSAIALSNAVDIANFQRREERYLQIVGKYDREGIDHFAQAFGELVMAMESARFADLLGATFMGLDLGNKWTGQFFTPYELCRMMAKMQMHSTKDIIEQNGFITMSDPCVGGGAMVIASAEALHDEGINYQKHLHVTATDIDSRSVHMAYVQLSLLNIPAVVVLGNSLSMEVRDKWYTPAHILGGWSHRLRRRDSDVVEPEATVTIDRPEQMTLFESTARYEALAAA